MTESTYRSGSEPIACTKLIELFKEENIPFTTEVTKTDLGAPCQLRVGEKPVP